MPHVENERVISDQTTTLPLYRFDRLSNAPITHGITTRVSTLPGDGDVNVAGRLPVEDARANRAAWCAEIGVDPIAIVSGRQVHGNRVQLVDAGDAGRGACSIEDAIPGTDALITQATGLPLLVYTADCVPAIIYDTTKHALGLAHAGWRGTVSNIAAAVVEAMKFEFGCDPSDLIVSLGPSIGPCCYEVGDEVIDAWRSLGVDQREDAVVSPAGERRNLDLWRANVLLFCAAGVPRDRIDVAGICTCCESDRFFSRRAGNGHRGLFATVAALE
jgi:YfiH family protein